MIITAANDSICVDVPESAYTLEGFRAWAAPDEDGWWNSAVFGCGVCLDRDRDRMGSWRYTLLVRYLTTDFTCENAMTSPLSNPLTREAVVPLTVEQYRQMGDAGIIDEKTELIDGVILQKMNKSPLHTLTVKKLLEILRPQLPLGHELRKAEPLTLPLSEPEPDIAIVAEGSYDPLQSHPSTACLVIEVALSSEAIDRAKASIYAEAGIPEYWLVLPEKKTLERFTDPSGEAYQEHKSHGFETTIQLPAPLLLTVDLRFLS